jgi:polyisoprenoid-binding protein YceI
MTLPIRLPALLLALAVFAAPTCAQTVQYRLDPVHTRVLVAVAHAGFSQALGTVSGSTGTLQFDPDDWRVAKLDATVPLQRLDFGDAEWNRAVLARNLLDAEDFPEARFVSTRIEPVDAQRATVFGELTLHGVTREVALDAILNQLKRHPLPPFRRTAGFSATTTIRRSDFGIDAWKSVIGDEVQIRLEVEALRERAGGDETPTEPEPR